MSEKSVKSLRVIDHSIISPESPLHFLVVVGTCVGGLHEGGAWKYDENVRTFLINPVAVEPKVEELFMKALKIHDQSACRLVPRITVSGINKRGELSLDNSQLSHFPRSR